MAVPVSELERVWEQVKQDLLHALLVGFDGVVAIKAHIFDTDGDLFHYSFVLLHLKYLLKWVPNVKHLQYFGKLVRAVIQNCIIKDVVDKIVDEIGPSLDLLVGLPYSQKHLLKVFT